MSQEPTKLQQYMANNRGLTKLEACKRREAQWQRFYDIGILKTEKSRDEWVADKLKEEGWFK